MARRRRDVARCAASCSGSAACGWASLCGREQNIGEVVRVAKSVGRCFCSDIRLRIDAETSGLLTREASAVRQSADILQKLAAPLCLREDNATMVSTSARRGFRDRQSFRKRDAWSTRALCLRHNAGPSWLWPARRAARVWSTGIADRHSARRRGAARSVALADTHYPRRRRGAPFREKFHIFTNVP